MAALREIDAGKPVLTSRLTRRVGERASTVPCTLYSLANAGLLHVAMDDARWPIALLGTGHALPHPTA